MPPPPPNLLHSGYWGSFPRGQSAAGAWLSRYKSESLHLWPQGCNTAKPTHTFLQVGSTVHRPGDDPRKEFEECGNVAEVMFVTIQRENILPSKITD
jgi:hypothetical protein